MITAVDQRNEPMLRFPEFKGEWRVEALGKYFEEFREKSAVQDQHEVLTSSRRGLMLQSEYYLNNPITDRENIGFNVLPPDHLTYRSRSDDRRFYFNENDLGLTGIISVYYPVFRIIGGENRFFRHLLLRYVDYIKFSVGTSQTVLSFTELKRIRLPLPSGDEQKRVANFLSAVEKRINLLEDRRDAFSAYKKGMMQRLFSRELRFTCDDGSPFPDWEEKRLGELFDEVKEKAGSRDLETYSISAGIGFVSQREKFGRDISGDQNPNYTALSHGQFSYNKGNSKTFKYGCVYLNRLGRAIAVPNVFISFEMKSDTGSPDFFQHLFEHHHLDRGLRRIISSSARMDGLLNVSKVNFFKLDLPVPHTDEQQKIADFLSALDAKINAVASQIDAMQRFKKGLLQQMFV
jgi:type I restriction enzyme S subunit